MNKKIYRVKVQQYRFHEWKQVKETFETFKDAIAFVKENCRFYYEHAWINGKEISHYGY